MAIPPKNFRISTQNARVEGVSNQDIEINTEQLSVEQSVEKIVEYINQKLKNE